MAFSANEVSLLKERVAQAQQARATWEAHAQDIVRYMMPFRPDIIASNYEVEGRKKMSHILLSHATHAGELQAAGMASKTANKQMKWFKVGTEDRDLQRWRPVKLWLDWLDQKYYQVYDKSNFYTAYHENMMDKVFLGSACTFVGRHPQLKVYFQSLNLGECYPAMNEYGQINQMYRKFTMTARNLATKFGVNKVSDKVKKLLDGNKPETQIEVLHAVEPRRLRQVGGKGRQNMPWSDIYIEYDNDQLLREGGFEEFPYIFSRYYAPPGQVWGRGPGMTALSTVRELQTKRRDILKAGQLNLDPTLFFPNTGFVGPIIKLMPAGRGGINFINTDDGNITNKIGTIPRGDLGYTDKDMEASKQEISAIFFNDLLIMAMEKEMTLGEFLRVYGEKMQMLGPFVGREEMECLTPIFQRTFNLLWDQGQIMRPPPELSQQGGRLRIEFTGILSQAQKATSSEGIVRTIGFAGQIMQMDPQASDRLDLDAALMEVAENFGCPQRLLRADEQVAQIRESRAQAQEAMKQGQQALEAVKAVPHLSQEPKPGSPIEQLMTLMKQGAGNA